MACTDTPRGDMAALAQERIDAATLLIDALCDHMPPGERRARCADAIKLHLLTPAILDLEAAAQQPRAIWRWLGVGALALALYVTPAALSFIGSCHDAGIPAPLPWPL